MTAAAQSTGQVQQAAESGKFALTNTQLLEVLGFGVLAVIILVVIVFVIHYFMTAKKATVRVEKKQVEQPQEQPSKPAENIIIYTAPQPEPAPPEPSKPPPVIVRKTASMSPERINLALRAPNFSRSALADEIGINKRRGRKTF
jgi:cell division protein FtsN